jgi:hypothetical protein
MPEGIVRKAGIDLMAQCIRPLGRVDSRGQPMAVEHYTAQNRIGHSGNFPVPLTVPGNFDPHNPTAVVIVSEVMARKGNGEVYEQSFLKNLCTPVLNSSL